MGEDSKQRQVGLFQCQVSFFQLEGECFTFAGAGDETKKINGRALFGYFIAEY